MTFTILITARKRSIRLVRLAILGKTPLISTYMLFYMSSTYYNRIKSRVFHSHNLRMQGVPWEDLGKIQLI
jgi:hypothetical protein